MPKKHTQSTKTRKRKGRDLDEIHEDLAHPDKIARLGNQPVDDDLPGAGQHYCIECDRHFVSAEARNKHQKSKAHKRRLQWLKEKPHTQREADLAAGLGVELETE